MRVLHVGPRPDSGQGNGVDVATWPMLTTQAREVDVSLLLSDPLRVDIATASAAGVAIHPIRQTRWRYRSRQLDAVLSWWRPDIVHVHSVFIPAQAALCARLHRQGIPYVVSPHGGLNLFRGGLKKSVYGRLLERRRLERAGAVLVLTPAEEQQLRTWLGGIRANFIELPNPAPDLPPAGPWELPAETVLVYLGRYDVHKKGLDRLVEIARLMPEAQIRCYGAVSKSEERDFQQLLSTGLPGNITFNNAVYGADKVAALQAATMYIHPARNEGFGMSIVEAMKLGVPAAVAASCDISSTLGRLDAALILPTDPTEAADALRSAAGQPSLLKGWADTGQRWVLDQLTPERVARRSLDLYESLVSAGRGNRR
jgi:glycosyltransferase involved in cell wall biosynthesis